MKRYEAEVKGSVEQCVQDSKAIMKYIMPWRNYWGRTDEYKKRVYSVKVLEMVRLQIERAIGLLGSVGGGRV